MSYTWQNESVRKKIIQRVCPQVEVNNQAKYCKKSFEIRESLSPSTRFAVVIFYAINESSVTDAHKAWLIWVREPTVPIIIYTSVIRYTFRWNRYMFCYVLWKSWKQVIKTNIQTYNQTHTQNNEKIKLRTSVLLNRTKLDCYCLVLIFWEKTTRNKTNQNKTHNPK